MIKKISVFSLLVFSGLTAMQSQEAEMGSVTDIDGNVYRTVSIGEYEWMAENLRTTRYRNGETIHLVTDDREWSFLSSGAYSVYENEKNNLNTYGALYNWYAVNTGNLCPVDWRIPSDEEWKYLEGFADYRFNEGDTIWDMPGLRGFDAAARLKSVSGWDSDGNGNDEFGFSALPGGERLSKNGRFFIIGKNGFWWTSTEDGPSTAIFRSMIYSFEQVSRDSHDKRFGFSVRCIRDKNPEE